MGEKVSAIISLVVAIIILSVSYFQWWDITWDGKMVFKKWLKILFAFSIILLLMSLIILIIF